MRSPEAAPRSRAFAVDNPDGVAVYVRVTPRSSKPGLKSVQKSEIELAVAAPPTDGAANEQVRKLLAKLLDVAPSRVVLTRGQRNRNKTFQVDGMRAADVRARLT